ncbi:MAG: hypothetical protein B6D61_06070 [Bacteroidetes bacterium 4484_249]|nr:MAG: hypothetical protein B6D61_06070 [Bacteroidetes bacterium 4484_249]
MKVYEKLKETLNKKGLKVTPQRIAVYRALLKLDNHPDTDQIIAQVLKENPSISSATIYKTLDTLTEHGIISRLKTDSGRMRFDHVIKNHHHLYDRNTDKIMDYSDDNLDKLLDDYFKSKKIAGFEIADVKLQIVGRFKKG